MTTTNVAKTTLSATALALADQQREALRQKVMARYAEGTAPTGGRGPNLYMRFNGNDGTLTIGRDKSEVAADQMFFIPLETVEYGVIEWAAKTPTGQERMTKMVDGAAPLQPPNTLAKGADPKRPLDGWGACLRCQLVGYGGDMDGINVELALHSQGAQDKLAELAATMFKRLADGEKLCNAVVTLSSDSYENKTYSKTIWFPVFTVVGWCDPYTVELNDEVAAGVLD